MIVPNCHVQELITETLPRQLGARHRRAGVAKRRLRGHPGGAPHGGRQSAVVIALGTVETTRVARTTFGQSLAGRAADRMGTNLIAHLRSNLAIRVPRAAIAANLPPTAINNLQCSALLVKGKAPNGRTFHFQITAAGLSKIGADSEAELFKKIPTLEHLQDMLRATDDTVVITIRGIGDMTPRNPDSFIDLSTSETDFGRPKAVVHLGNAKASPQQFPGSAQTQNDRTTWDAMDAISDTIALIFAGDERFDILASATRVIPVPAGTKAQRLAVLAAFKGRRDDLGTTHHDAGTMRMGDNIADSVTNDFGRIHDTTNCYVAGPALFPTVGSPNPMLTSVALGRRTAFLLNENVLPGPDPVVSPQSEAGFRPLFDGTAATFKNWRLAGSPGGDGKLRRRRPPALLLRCREVQQFYAAPAVPHRRRQRPQQRRIHSLPESDARVCNRRTQKACRARSGFDSGNPAWKPVIAGFEVQIDDTAAGDSTKDFYGIRPEPPGKFKNRTGAIYKIQAGDRIWHLNANEPAVQNYTPGPALVPGVWFEYEIVVQGDDYTVFLSNLQTGVRQQTTAFHNTGSERGRTPGFIGVHAYVC